MADLDLKTATLREVAEAYAKKSGRKGFVGPTIQYFKDIADEPGSALLLFQKDNEGRTLLAKTFTSVEENAPVKASMQNLRQVGLLLKESTGPDTPEYKLLPDEKPDTDLNKRIFGRAEPPKNQAQVAISADPKKQAALFEGVSKFLDNPETRPAALAILFNLNTGLRPNAVLNLTLDQYYPDTGAIYIEADVQGAKGRAVNIPLNPVADSILQELLVGKKPGDNFFTKSAGGNVKTTDMNKILRDVKVPQIMYDQATKTFYDSLHPENGPGKTGSPLLRNVHSTVALSKGIPQERTSYLQGRSLKAASKGSTGEIATYQNPFPGEVSDVDREFSSRVSSFYGEAATNAGFDIQSKLPTPDARITTQTPGYENYFELPVKQEVPAPVVSEPKLDATVTVSSKAEAQLKKDGLWDLLYGTAKGVVDKIPPKVIKAIPFVGAPAGYEIAKETASDMGLPGFLPEIIGAAGAAAEVVSPIAPTDIKDASIGFSGVIEKGEQERQALLNRARQSKTTNIDRGPEAAPATQPDQGFLSR
jgi:hypothetical protein